MDYVGIIEFVGSISLPLSLSLSNYLPNYLSIVVNARFFRI